MEFALSGVERPNGHSENGNADEGRKVQSPRGQGHQAATGSENGISSGEMTTAMWPSQAST